MQLSRDYGGEAKQGKERKLRSIHEETDRLAHRQTDEEKEWAIEGQLHEIVEGGDDEKGGQRDRECLRSSERESSAIGGFEAERPIERALSERGRREVGLNWRDKGLVIGLRPSNSARPLPIVVARMSCH
ncbi:unnamed protein product [Calypogeia fissa]